jgi:hypothetical protein
MFLYYKLFGMGTSVKQALIVMVIKTSGFDQNNN